MKENYTIARWRFKKVAFFILLQILFAISVFIAGSINGFEVRRDLEDEVFYQRFENLFGSRESIKGRLFGAITSNKNNCGTIDSNNVIKALSEVSFPLYFAYHDGAYATAMRDARSYMDSATYYDLIFLILEKNRLRKYIAPPRQSIDKHLNYYRVNELAICQLKRREKI